MKNSEYRVPYKLFSLVVAVLFFFSCNKVLASNVYNYDYTGSYQTFNVPTDGYYKLETWGAQGGKSVQFSETKGDAGTGGYSSGLIKLTAGTKLYIYVGQQGATGNLSNSLTASSFNGGGAGIGSTDRDDGGGAGGGATDIRLVNGSWDNSSSLNSRIMVSGGGSGSAVVGTTFAGKAGGSGGGIKATGNIWNYQNVEVSNSNYNATQTQGYKFGIGQDGIANGNAGGAGAGGGYWGGYSSKQSVAGGAGGGSGYVSGYKGCVAITSATSTTPRNDSNSKQCTETSAASDITCSYHYSGYTFTNISLIDGNSSIPTHDGLSTQIGNTGNGYAKISFIKELSENAYLSSLYSDKGTLSPEFY